MAVCDIVLHPDPVLLRVADAVTDFSPAIDALAIDLHDTLKAHGGIGLSAPQIAQSVRMLVLKIDGQPPQVYINPTIVSKEAVGFVQESCLSLPGVSGNVWRATKITVKAQNTHGDAFEQQLTGMSAVCIQHEIDHLDGILITDRFSKIKKLSMKVSAAFSKRRAAVASKPLN
jgi:peptide deformylase